VDFGWIGVLRLYVDDRAPEESVDAIAAHAPDLHDLKPIEHT